MRIILPGLEPAPPSCDLSGEGPTKIEAIQEFGIPAGELGATRVVLVSAGDALVIRTVGMKRGTHARVNVLFKQTADDGPFTGVCRSTPLRADGPGLVARAPAALGGSLWRVEVSTEPTAERGEVGRIELSRVPGQAADPDWTRLPEPWNNALGFLCLESSDEAFRSRRVRTGFAGKVRLDVDLDDAASPLDASQRAAIEEVILRAVSLWATACGACRTEQLTVVHLDGRLLARRGLAEWLTKFGEGPTSPASDTAMRALDAELVSKLEPSMVLGAGKPDDATHAVKDLEPYEPLAPDGEALRRLCSLEVAGGDKPVLTNVRIALCAPKTMDERLRSSIQVTLRRGRTYCGDDPEIIACRADEHLTEYNVRDYRFFLGSPSVPPIGTGAIEVDLLHAMLHEMGHWIGLGHIEGGQSVMSAGLDRSRCIDPTTVAALIRGIASGDAQEGAGPSAFTLNSVRPGRTVDESSDRRRR
ncbi:hypothetical protein [Lichenibacterium dinghuense]|uniref:hypothetical protein n=1 Tax=Lichenibacterium dinghuense TaxID=2895977 RepID=UPI001F1CFBF6|nr:hypothetical protein [Lichenibacterium sp. 6Y81]